MKIVVYDVTAERGGALFVLEDFYKDALDRYDWIEWHFFVSVVGMNSSKSITIHYYPKKQMVKRVLFEQGDITKEIKSINPDLIVSLQNMPLIFANQRQYVYLHQSLQYCYFLNQLT